MKLSADEFLMFNARTLALAKVTDKIQKQIMDLDWSEGNKALFSELSKQGFIVSGDFDEKASISEDLWRSRNNQSVCSLTIAPTLGCNFNCAYCFESEEVRSKYDYMSESVQDNIISFLNERFQKYSVQNFNVCWFGGEPLLALNSIVSLSDKLKILSRKLKITYDNASIVTNGYKLNRKVAAILKDCGIISAQVTIDGPDYIHDNRRVLKGGKGSFNRIIKNLLEASSCLDIIIRINIDKQNKGHLVQFAEQLKDQIYDHKINNIQVYASPVVDSPEVEEKFKISLSSREFALVEEHFTKTAESFGVKLPKAVQRVNNFCGADHKHSYMIGPNGELYNCWEDFGNESLVIGDVGNGRHKNYKYIEQYDDFDPTQHPKCSDCKVLTLCMGGCPKHRLLHNEPQCGVFKFNLKDYILKEYKKSTALVVMDKEVAESKQIRRLNSLDMISKNFHAAVPNNFILNFIPRYQSLDKYLDEILLNTNHLNQIDLMLLKECKYLLNGKITNDLYLWAKAIKENYNLSGIKYAIRVINYIEKEVIKKSIKILIFSSVMMKFISLN